MVKELNELTWLVSRQVDRAEEHLAFLCKNKPEILSLYRAIRDHNFQTDEAVIKGANIGERTSYKKYGSQLSEHLHQLVLFIKPAADPYSMERNEAFKSISIMRLAEFNSCKRIARTTAEELIEKGIRNDRPEWVVEASKTLLDAMASSSDKPGEFEHFAKLYQEYKSYLDWQEKAKLYFDHTRLAYIRKKGNRREAIRYLQQCVEQLQPAAQKIPAMHFHLCYYLMACNHLFLIGDYKKSITVIEEALTYFQTRAYSAPNLLLVFNYRKVMCYTQLKAFEAGEMAIQQCMALAQEGTLNWYATLEVYFYLSMHTGHYQKALEIYQTATGHKRFSSQREAAQETWKILGAYLFLTYKLTRTPLPEQGIPRFKSSKFLNETVIYNQDKNGMNVAILIAHVIMQITEGKTLDVYDRVEALEKYRERYLNTEETERSQLFIKWLIQLAKADFRHRIFEPKSGPLLQRMREVPYDASNQPYELEVIPYEQLCELIMAYLKPPVKLPLLKGTHPFATPPETWSQPSIRP